ncbi:alcohol oxidase [Auricularia subglabra TFB-10046 SS5]|nr:alcohol oxidase [Auricularia subglabra TFB-10046 SS5]
MAHHRPFTLRLVQLLVLARAACAYSAAVAREISASDASASYDYIVAGGGQAGLVIANRLSEDPSKTVLVVEYGDFSTNPSQEEPSSSAQGFNRPLLYNVTATPQAGLNGALDLRVYAAAVVGGGSTINGMMLDRGSPDDYDNWAKLQNPGWSFKDLLPYFKKANDLTPPSPSLAQEFNITWDQSAYGTNSPVHLSFPSFQYPGLKNQYKAAIQAGVQVQKEGALHAYGLFWFPTALDPTSVKRSYAVSGYYRPAEGRPNLHLITNTRVNEVIFDASKRAVGITMQQREADGAPPSTTPVQTIKATREIVLTSGFLHTPQILQRSGVGPAPLLQAAGIPVVVDLPGVGANFQDHPATTFAMRYDTDVSPHPSMLGTDANFTAWADEVWAANRTGPRSLTVGNVGSWLPLSTMTSEYKSVVQAIRAQNVTEYLPPSYDSSLIAGFVAQRRLLADSFSRPTTGVIEFPFAAKTSTSLSLEHPLSRGTVRINPANKYAEPIVDYGTYINPADPLIIAKGFHFARKWMSQPAMQELSPVELTPGPAVATDEQLVAATRGASIPSTAHGCCTSAMSPRSLGGVVAPDLRVHGVAGLSVGDISIMPLIPGAHTCTTVYAIAEKAADLIKARTQDVPYGGKCGGADYTGSTICKSPFKCRRLTSWDSRCL